MTSPQCSRLVRSLAIGSLAAVIAGGLAAPGAAFALAPLDATASNGDSIETIAPDAIRAWVTSIEHDAGRITITGTAYAGEEVLVSGPGVAPTSTRADWNGVFTAIAEVDDFGAHEITLTSATGPATVVRATTQADPAGGLFVARGPHDATLASFGAWRAGATVNVLVDGRPVGSAPVDGAGKWAYLVDGIPYGRHTIEAQSFYDGAVQAGVRQIQTFVADPVVETSDVDLRGDRVVLTGTAQDDTVLAFSDEDAPITTIGGQQTVPVIDGRWSVELPLPGGSSRFWTVGVTALADTVAVGSTEARVTVPLAFTSTVDVYKPKKLVLSGTGEVNATVTFTDAEGSPILDKDGQPITASIGRGVWTRTIDPRLFADGTVTATATVDGRFVGESTVTFR